VSTSTQEHIGPTPDLIGLVTCQALPEGDEDAPLLLKALHARAIRTRWLVWDDPDADWDSCALSVVRSPWDYTADRLGFLRWAAATPRLLNPVGVLAWNSDKVYLRDLDAAEIPIVATRWIEPGGDFSDLEHEPGEFVLKPTVGAGSKGAGRFDPRAAGALDRARTHGQSLHEANRTVMVQPYLAGVDDVGEAGLLYFGATYSHAITKLAMLAPATVNVLDPGYSRTLFVPERIRPRTPTAAERDLGDRVLAYVSDRFGVPLYMRVDLLPTPAGPVVIEVELIEPSLFLSHDQGAADRLAEVIAGRLAPP
jgi:hypothetical protein